MIRPTDQRSTTSGGQASPATSSVLTAGRDPSGRTASAADGRVTWVTPNSAAVATSSGPTARRSAGTTTSAAPAHREIQVSQTDESKLGEANSSTREPGPHPSRSAWVAASAATPVCVTATPLGRPVDPEV